MTDEIANPFVGFDFPSGAGMDMDARAADYLQGAIRKARSDYFVANCPPNYREFDIEHRDIQSNRAQIDRVLAWNFGPKGILAAGPTRRGKTRAMFALCKRLLCVEAVDVGMWHAKDFFSALESEVRFGRDDADGFVKRVASRRVLFIDDFGQEAVQANREAWARGWFFRLLEIRRGAGLPLLITTNLSAEQLSSDRYDLKGDPLVSRLLDLSEPIKFN